jgi:hypothetical protein
MLSIGTLALGLFLAAEAAPAPRPVEHAWIESSLATGGPRIRQFAFDTNDATWFASEKKATTDDHLTLRFDRPVKLESIVVLTGLPTGGDVLTNGVIEVSENGTGFTELAKLSEAKSTIAAEGKSVAAIRIRPAADLEHPLVVREIRIDSDPKVVAFKFPIEIALDVNDAPEMKPWAEKVVRVCERQYAMLCEELASPGYEPPTRISMVFKKDYKGVAAAGGGRITGSVDYFKSRPDDVGAMVHETAHCVQNYRGRRLPGWLVEGIADYVRFWKYEPGKAGRLAPERAKYDASYRTTAAFLAYVSEKYDPHAVNKLNAALRENKYDVAIWKELTGKDVETLNQEWRQSLVK